jgi:hypothetical protein
MYGLLETEPPMAVAAVWVDADAAEEADAEDRWCRFELRLPPEAAADADADADDADADADAADDVDDDADPDGAAAAAVDAASNELCHGSSRLLALLDLTDGRWLLLYGL